MAVRISALPALTTLAVEDKIPVTDDSTTTTKYATGQKVLDFVQTNLLGSMAELGDNQLNPILNGAFNVWQDGTSFTSTTTPANNDDTYLMDQWYLLSDGNDTVDVTRETSTIPTGGLYACALDVETINKKFGIAQIIEQKNCVGFIGQTCTFSFKAKVSSTTKLDNIKAAIIAWSSTADTVTSDVVSAWGIEGTNPTLAANLTYENSPGNLSVTTNYATYSVSAAIDTASTTNIILFIWSDVTDTTLGDFLYITDAKLEVGSAASAFQPRLFQDELRLCERYYQKSFNYATAPAQNVGVTTGEHRFNPSVAGAVASNYTVKLHSRMRVAPTTLTTYNPAAANAEVRNITDGADFTTTSATAIGDTLFIVTSTGTAGTALGESLGIHWTASARL